tara:strand:+ start:117 stop:374 length:258 start_codon:yes stop_codon:yes gene_type:complete
VSKIQEEIARGNKAAEVLRNPAFEEAFEVLHNHYLETWQNTHPDEAETREKIFIAINVLKDIRANIESVMTTGKLAGEEGSKAFH